MVEGVEVEVGVGAEVGRLEVVMVREAAVGQELIGVVELKGLERGERKSIPRVTGHAGELRV